MQHSGMKIAQLYRIFHDVVSKVVRLAIDDTRADAGASQPHAEAARMVIATLVVARQLTLTVHRAPELPSPDDESVFEQASLFQIGDEPVACSIDIEALPPMVPGQSEVGIPSPGFPPPSLVRSCAT